MGYYSSFDIQVKGITCEDFAHMIERLSQQSGYTFIDSSLEYDLDHKKEADADKDYTHNFAVDDVKWYSIEEDLRIVSKEFPMAAILVCRDGEDARDYEEIYAMNGEVENCQAVVPDPVVIPFYKDFNSMEFADDHEDEQEDTSVMTDETIDNILNVNL